MNGLCEEGVYECSGFHFKLGCFKRMVDGWCKADWIDRALKIFDSMDTRDSFPHPARLDSQTLRGWKVLLLIQALTLV